MTVLSVRFDPEADAGYVRFTEGRIDDSSEVAPGLIVDWTVEDEPVGLEILDVRDRVGAGDPESYLKGLAEGWLSAHKAEPLAAE